MWLAFESINMIGLRYSSAVGRALVLAQSFESNCKYVLLIAQLGLKLENGDINVSNMASYSAQLERWFKLGRDIMLFGSHHQVSEDEIEILRKGVDARNYIAHQAAYPILSGKKADSEILQELPNFVAQVSALAAAENLIGQWSFMIQEKVTPPQHLITSFPLQVTQWVIGDITHNRSC